MIQKGKLIGTPHVHKILAHSYAAFFLFFLLGVCLDLVFSLKVFNVPGTGLMGFTFLVVGTFLVIWAQKTTRSLKKENITKETFCHGPYCFTRSPTHWGLFLLMLGFGLITNAFFVMILSFVSLIFNKLTFLVKEERLLAEKYGEPYMEYKRSVRI